MALYFVDESNFEEARTLLERATTARSDYLKAWSILGHVYQSPGDSTAALASYEKAVCAEARDEHDQELIANAQENIEWLEVGDRIR